ncbi:Uncharacterized protein HZ326_25025 [Fusarium oxysporum f. sp. albedinis]|nr:Uncharacterized protein HZ326_25025 [Fusarium oxysporum f. sp. albedinis]
MLRAADVSISRRIVFQSFSSHPISKSSVVTVSVGLSWGVQSCCMISLLLVSFVRHLMISVVPHREAGNSIGDVRRRDLEHLKCLNKHLKQQIQCPKVSSKSNSTTDLICLICGQRWFVEKRHHSSGLIAPPM